MASVSKQGEPSEPTILTIHKEMADGADPPDAAFAAAFAAGAALRPASSAGR